MMANFKEFGQSEASMYSWWQLIIIQSEARAHNMVLSPQESKAAAEQQHAHIEAEIKTLKENAALDFERIGLLSEENAGLQVLSCRVNCRRLVGGVLSKAVPVLSPVQSCELPLCIASKPACGHTKVLCPSVLICYSVVLLNELPDSYFRI